MRNPAMFELVLGEAWRAIKDKSRASEHEEEEEKENEND